MSSVVATRAQDVPSLLIRALFRHPESLQTILRDAGLAPHDLARWARQIGASPDIEKLAGWLGVGQQPGHYKPLLEVACSHLRAGDWHEALPVFRWAYREWLSAPQRTPIYYADGTRLLARWGECLHRLGHFREAQAKWLLALDSVLDESALSRVLRVIAGVSDEHARQLVLAKALRHGLPGAKAALEQRQPHADVLCELSARQPAATDAQDETGENREATGIAVMADVANLDMACRDQYGPGSRPAYDRLLREAEQCGPVHVKLAFVPDVPATLISRHRLAQVGFVVDLKRPKRSHGRLVANADTAMAAAAVRWASDARIGRVELWTGDGDFIKVREVIGDAWPGVAVAFRSFEIGTATAIRRLGQDWHPVGAHCLEQTDQATSAPRREPTSCRPAQTIPWIVAREHSPRS